jgi:type IV pilus assembly protein PilB
VNTRAGLSFASALRSILRADPDIVLVGEIRDRETAQIALEASLTGHMVLSTLHTNDAPSSLTRMVELGVEPYLVASSVTAVIAQRLARRLCGKCKVATVIDESTLSVLSQDTESFTEAHFYKPVGCISCSNTGYRGRLAIHEIMLVTEEIQKLTMANASSAEISSMAEQQGLTRLLDDGLLKAGEGLTSVEEILRVVG